MRHSLFCFWLITLCCFSQTRAQYRLEIDVENISLAQGILFVSIFESPASYNQNQIKKGYFQKVSVNSKQLQIVFENLPKGYYAIKAYHDANNNNELDKNWMGIPKESYGFSNNVMSVMGPPSFEQSAFLVQANTQHNLILR